MPQFRTGKILKNVFHALKCLCNIDEMDVRLIALYTTSYTKGET
jgi:hypothetical protein